MPVRPERVLLVGHGMVGHRFCERLVERALVGKPAVTVLCEELRPAYDRVHLTSYLGGKSADELTIAEPEWYAAHGIELRVGVRAERIERSGHEIVASDGTRLGYDRLVLATGSRPFVPPIPGTDRAGVFVYRTFDDLDAIRASAQRCKRAAVLGGGLLGLEAAKAVLDLGLETHVIELAPRLMPRQLDATGAALLASRVEALGVRLHLGAKTTGILGDTDGVRAIELEGGTRLDVDMVVISAGIIPRDEIARAAGLEIGPRGGVVVDDGLATSDPCISAIGEVALHRGTTYGLVGPGYEMADVLARRLAGEDARFTGSDLAAKLKLLGVEVASFGDAVTEDGARYIAYTDHVRGVHKKLVLDGEGRRLRGGVLVGDASSYEHFLDLARRGAAIPEAAERLLLEGAPSAEALADEAQVCSCNQVSKAAICAAIRESDATTIQAIRACTRAGTGCGGCVPLVGDILASELAASGRSVRARLCEHFEQTRQELYHIVQATGIRSFDAVLWQYGRGQGCEICKPAVASILASTWNENVFDHQNIQDTNDRFLANMQRGGLYSVIPRVPGGEITPQKLIALGRVAEKYGLYTKITGGQRIDLFGARVHQLPDIWEELVEAGFESGHAYGKAMRTVKSCVGTTWCRYGVQDSVAFAIRVEERYKGIRAPHKMKAAVSGCTRECAEAQSKDFGLIATEKGYNVYVCGNGGMRPRHADLLAADVDEETALRYLDRFIVFYIRTADRLTRTSVWLEKMEGGIDYLRDVIVHDKLGIAADLERQMQHLVDTYECEWAAVVRDPEKRARFRHFVDSLEPDHAIEFVDERGQRRPADWARTNGHGAVSGNGHAGLNGGSHGSGASDGDSKMHRLPTLREQWVHAGRVEDFPRDAGVAVKHGDTQLVVFHFASRGEWYACQNMCPHKRDMVLARGLLGDEQGTPKVACPMHKKTFALTDGRCLSDDGYRVETFPVKVQDGVVYVDVSGARAPEACEGARDCEAASAPRAEVGAGA